MDGGYLVPDKVYELTDDYYQLVDRTVQALLNVEKSLPNLPDKYYSLTTEDILEHLEPLVVNNAGIEFLKHLSYVSGGKFSFRIKVLRSQVDFSCCGIDKYITDMVRMLTYIHWFILDNFPYDGHSKTHKYFPPETCKRWQHKDYRRCFGRTGGISYDGYYTPRRKRVN